MSLKDILVCLDPTDAGESRLRLAAAIAHEHGAHLSAAYVLPDKIAAPPPHNGLGGGLATGPAWLPQGRTVARVPVSGEPPAGETDVTRGAALAEIIKQRFREAIQPHAIDGDWHLFGSHESADLVALLSAVDLVIFGQTSPDYRVPTGFRPGDIALACSRPMLVVPYVGTFGAVGRRVLVAWDGSREASRALQDALPLIGKAEAVSVMTVRAGEASFERDRPSLDRIVKHLERHGIPAQVEEALHGDLPIADVLLSGAARRDVDLIVAGAYHHSPLREALLGGVSRGLLDHMTVPVLMSH